VNPVGDIMRAFLATTVLEMATKEFFRDEEFPEYFNVLEQF
jgi:hypothetical protein